jgi:hypothetical protein
LISLALQAGFLCRGWRFLVSDTSPRPITGNELCFNFRQMPYNINMKTLDSIASDCEPGLLRGIDFANVGTVKLPRFSTIPPR